MNKEKNEMSKQDKVVYSIIALIAMLIFIVITAIGCTKLEKAEAATTSDGKYYPCLWSEVDWGQYESYKSDIKSVCTDFIVQGDGSSSGYYCIYLFNEPHRLIEHTHSSTSAYEYWGNYLWFVGVQSGVVREVRYNDNVGSPIYYQINGSYISLIGGTYDYRHADMPSNTYRLLPYVAIKEPTYLVNAPYLQYKSLSIYNALASTMYETDI